MRFTRRLAVSCLAALFALPLFAANGSLMAGVAKVDITPPPGQPMYGFLDRIKNHEVAKGTLDPLYARVLVLAVGGQRLALVTLDLGRTFGQSELDRLRARARGESGIDDLIVVASHTHSGPNILDFYPPGQTPPWETTALAKIAGAIRTAAGRLAPATIGAGYGTAYIGYNRRVVDGSGQVTMLWSDPAKTPNPPLDPTVGVLRIDGADGQPLAILVNYACHPVIFGHDNLDYSADYVGVALQTVAAAFDGRPLCFFLQGADGDINPYFASTPRGQGAVAKRDWTGHELGAAAAAVAKGIRTRPDAAPSLQFADDVMSFPLRWNPRQFQAALLRVDGPAVFQDHADLLAASPPPASLDLHVTTLLIDHNFAFVGMPGEPFVDFQVNWRNRCPVRNCFFLGYANGYFDYFPTIRAAAEGGYGAADSDTYVTVGAGERMLDRAMIRAREMLGELVPVPQTGRAVFDQRRRRLPR